MENTSKSMNLKKLKTQLENVCHMEKNDKMRRENLFQSLAEAEQRRDALQLRIEQLKQIKDRYKEYVMKTWPTMRNSYHEQQSVLEDKKTINKTHDLKLNQSGPFTPEPEPEYRLPEYRLPEYRLPEYRLPEYRLPGGVEVQEPEIQESIQLRFPKSSKPREREVKLNTYHQPVVSYPQGHEVVETHKEKDLTIQEVKTNSKQLKFKLDNDESRLDKKSDAYDKLLQTSNNETKLSQDESSEDETDVERQMAAFVTRDSSKKSSDINVTRSSKMKKKQSSSDDSSESKENIQTTATTMQSIQKLAARHLGLDSDSDVSPIIEQTNKINEKDEDFTFFD